MTARRSLHTTQPKSFVSNITSALSAPSQLLSNVQSQLTKGYEAVKDRVTQLAGYGHGGTPDSPSRGSTRHTRTSSQSSGSGGGAKGYNLRSRPVHSTPRDSDKDQQTHHRKTTTSRKDQNEEIDEEDEDSQTGLQYYWKKYVYYVKKLFHSPIDIFDTVWDKLKCLPWWLLIPLLLLLGLYASKLIFNQKIFIYFMCL